ncbi:carboxylesterase/lipase family protein [Actinoplanes sp. G11-F43]|uniref:carboxylesterase/lipase family protein n=1 Tax=Actinoplanes sp. G11-F43 TaxID=3424130 RepID=UPI003D343A51
MTVSRLLAVLMAASLTVVGCDDDRAPTAPTGAGTVQGVREDGLTRFRGIPYAAPPTGDLRWRAPQPPAAWDGIRPAEVSAPGCAQGPDLPAAREDCLYLDVTAPAGAENRPVLVWLHGGGLSEGVGADYDPARMVRQGDVVVVTVEFRLGMFGFFGAPGLDGSGTFGLQDQQAALRWVGDNIRAFGGDPGNVTLIGESGGAIGTCAQLTAPGAAGLVHRAIMQSGDCEAAMPKDAIPTGSEAYRFFQPLATTEAAGTAAMTALGCADVACLRAKPAEALHEQYPNFGAAAFGTPTLPRDPAEALRSGDVARVPVLAGANRHEQRLTAGLFAVAGWWISAEEYPGLITRTFGDRAPAILREYPVSEFGGDGAIAWADVFTDSMACAPDPASAMFPKLVPTFEYEFADEDAQPFTDLPDGFRAGASHASELPNLFDVAGREPIGSDRYTDAQRRLADRMIGYWTAFARTGDPNHRGAEPWPRAAAGRVTTLQLAPDDIRPVDVARVHRCDFWRALGS